MRQIKANPATRNIPVIALTAHAMASDREKALEAGCEAGAPQHDDITAIALRYEGK